MKLPTKNDKISSASATPGSQIVWRSSFANSLHLTRLTCIYIQRTLYRSGHFPPDVLTRIIDRFSLDARRPIRDMHAAVAVGNADALKLDGRTVAIPELFEPHAYARAEFLLDSDPGAWRFAQAGEIDDGSVAISYGPQVLPDRERRAFLYVRVALPAAQDVAEKPGLSTDSGDVRQPTAAG
ncbi:hypothetical protein [Burkholderia sp. S-53]|uniref:hypothetical protein n=1 Tax=Burkholderia sp. S-53 TaxID=2906514 RepID=UPI0021D133F7|nr:hypothetical protein [Burkholderia sp. S-53]UXU85311.1 hypothetical protein LXM88_02805 [Burkholderia sp. S-53]